MTANNLSADSRSPQLKVRIVVIKRSSKVTKGGRRFSFSALAVVGNGCGRVGIGFGKSHEVAHAVMKAEASAATEMMNVSLKERTIPHEVWGQYCGAKVLLRPAPRGTGIIASKPIRAVLECAGVKDAVSKSLGARNAANVVKATIQALMSTHEPEPRLKIKQAKDFILSLLDPDWGNDNLLN